MTPRDAHGLRDAAAAAGGADACLVDPRLREQELVRRVDIAGPFLGDDALRLLWRDLGGARAAAVAESAIID